ncbi:MAG: hypothetical protein QXW23_08005 [Thermofilaceae archaeon]
MVVYVKLKVRGREERELVALVNGGAHSPVPVLVVDEVTARELGYITGEVAEASVADARRKVYIVRETVELSLLGEEGEELSRVKAHLVIHPGLEEPPHNGRHNRRARDHRAELQQGALEARARSPGQGQSERKTPLRAMRTALQSRARCSSPSMASPLVIHQAFLV